MKNKIKYITIFILLAAIYFFGCTDLFTNPSSSGTNSKIGITIQGPISNDTIGYDGTIINYTLKKDSGINFIELYVNGVINKWNPPNSDGSEPVIPIAFDSSKINSRISYYLIYYDKDGSSAKSETMNNILISEIRTPPTSPYDVTVVNLPDSSINLSWKDSTKSVSPSYEIWRKIGFYGTFEKYATSPPNTFNLNDNNLSDTTVYYYMIKGMNIYGTSDFSKVATTYGEGANHSIAPPTQLKVTALSASQVFLTWHANIANVNYFKIERRYSWSQFEGVGNVPNGTTQYTDKGQGLYPSNEYWYRVKAYSSSDSSWSNEVYVKTPAM